jgi:PAS domain S-box-containing protein
MSNIDAVIDHSAVSDAHTDLARLGQRLRDTLDTLREAVFQIGLDRRCQFVNAAWSELTGQCISESLDEPLDSFFWGEDQAAVQEFVERTLHGEQNQEAVELRLRKRDGTFIWVELRTRVVCDDTGLVIGLSGTILNINDRRHTEKRLRESEHLFRTAFDLSPNGIAIYAVDGKFTQCNQAMCELFGYSSGQLVTMDLFALTQPDDISQARKAVRRAQSGKPIRGIELRCMTREGRKIWVDLSASLLSANLNEPALVLLQLQDLSERKQAETDLQSQNQILFHAKGMLEAQKMELDQQAEQLQLARQLAEDANKAKTELLTNVSHEVRTPLTNILGFSELLLDPTQSDAQRSDCVDAIRGSGQHLLRIVDDILDVARIEMGRLQLEYSNVRLQTIVNEVVSLMTRRAKERSIDLVCEFAAGIPTHIRSDAVRLRQILLNLVSNAIKFTEHGSVKIVVDMSRPNPASGRRFLRLRVTDTGIGMSPQQMGRLFQAFESGQLPSGYKHNGIGLGLVITRRLVEMLGGTIEVTSQEDHGTTFVVGLDVEATSPCPEEPSGSRSDPVSRTIANDEYPALSGRVLLVEDGKDNQKLMGFMLRRCGLNVTFANDGAAALSVVESAAAGGQNFDLILMDMHMPGLDGYKATRTLREQGVATPIVAVTAHAMPGEQERCMAAGCNEYLAKPIERRVLIKSLSRHLQTVSVAAPQCTEEKVSEQAVISRVSNDPVMRDILAQYILEMPWVVSRLVGSMSRNDLKSVHSIMHELKGSAGGYGFDEISLLASAAEASIRLGADRQHVEQSVQEVVKLLRRVHGYESAREVAA